MNHFSLFTGIGGIDLAAEWAGFETVGQCEFADYPTKVLEKHWPDIPRWRDVRYVTVQSVRERGIESVTLLSGGFPCQPHSLAGERKASADERDLWGEFARIICEIKPRWVLGENVRGLLSSEDGRFFGRVLNDLADMGYNAGWCVYGADRVGAPHQRERVFIVAHSNGQRLERLRKGGKISRDVSQKGVALISSNYGTQAWNKGESEFLRMGDGVSNRVDRIKCLGNAVVPQQVYPILQAIADIENSAKEATNGPIPRTKTAPG